ncbi:hypothetical protein PH213_21685 [Streptomyces sp. SRF1]|uniref:ferredoxin n=1 Tax=Streptomyces sp. SRF1 TaxID=1549642 RepID=UPI0025AFFE7B|nr:hypothetical protein [Streptomyces sp. SRF1]MDN3057110.1 hypothetical protein [Streptomyces sp. SRF1]
MSGACRGSDQDDEGLAVVLVEEPAGDLREEVLRVVDLCPWRVVDLCPWRVVDLCPSRSLRVLG